MTKRFIPSALTAALTLVLLSACGDSDIEQIEQRELDDAQRAVAFAAESGTQNPTTTDAAEGDEDPAVGEANSGIDMSDLELLFSDEFNGNSLDSAKWSTALPWGPDLVINDELQYYVDTQSNQSFGYNPFSFDGESLTISAIETPGVLQTDANGQPYLSGVLSSAGKFEIIHGYIEARMDFPEGTGLWPAFWMLSADFVDLKPQLFIAEGNGGLPDSIFHNYNYHDEDGNLRSPGQWQVTQDDFSEGFHTLGVSWKTDELLFYIDGVPRYRVIGENVSNQAMYLIANLAVGGIWTGSPDSTTTLPAELKIDYIRAYRFTGP